MSENRRVVITGMGLISPLGNTLGGVWDAISNGKSGIDLLTLVPSDHFPSDIGGECSDFSGTIDDFGDPEKKLKRSIKKSLKMMCREIQMGVAAAQLCCADAAMQPDDYDPSRVGTMFGSDYIITSPAEFRVGVHNCMDKGNFEFEQWADDGLTKVEPTWLLKYLPNMPASHVAILNDLQGPSNSLTVREASSNLAVAEATTIIRRGSADAMVVGATGSRIHPLRTVHVALQEQLADRHVSPSSGDPQKASRPFDLNRTGMVLGEGAAVIMLEEMETAKKRGAKIYAEVTGYGSSAVINPDGVADYRTSLSNVIKSTLETSGMGPSDIGHVHAHGLSAIKGDREEAVAIKEVLDQTPVTAAKSYMGNLGAGSGMVELITSVMALEKDELFPILNFETADPDCPINAVTEKSSPGNSFVNLNVTPQGQASAVLISKAV